MGGWLELIGAEISIAGTQSTAVGGEDVATRSFSSMRSGADQAISSPASVSAASAVDAASFCEPPSPSKLATGSSERLITGAPPEVSDGALLNRYTPNPM